MSPPPEGGTVVPAPDAAPSPDGPLPEDPLHGAFVRYRIMAFIVGTALLALFVVILFQAAGYHPKLAEEIIAPIHGYLYLVYLVAGADLARRARWRLGRILVVVCAGFIPTLAFFIEAWINWKMKTERYAALTDLGYGPSVLGTPPPPPRWAWWVRPGTPG